MAFECCVEALVTHHATGTDPLGELLSLETILFTFGAVGRVKE